MAASSERRWWLLVAFALPLYALLYDNYNSWPTALGYGWTRLIPMPRQLRLAEIAGIGGLFVLALMHGVSRLTRTLIAGTSLFFSVALMSYMRSEQVPVLDGVRLIYMWILPVMLFIIGREAPWGRRAWFVIVGTAFVWILASAAVSWIQLGILTYPVGDDITGLNKDAHANGTLLMFAGLHWLAYALFRRKPFGYPMALLMLLTMVLSSVLKVMFLGVAAVGIVLWVHFRTVPRGPSRGRLANVKWIVAACLAVGAVGNAFTHIDEISYSRLGDFEDRLLNSPQNLGPMAAHTVAITKIAREVPTLLLGLGPFHFANPISVGQVEGNLALKANNDVLAIGEEKGEQARITLSSSLLAEFGLPAFTIVLMIYFAIGQAVWRCRLTANEDVRWRAVGLIASGFILGVLPFTSLFGSFDVMSVTFPLMMLAGIVCREAALVVDTSASEAQP